MSKRNQQAKLDHRPFKKSTNPITKALYQDGLCLSSPTNSDVVFFDDMQLAHIATANGRYFKNAKEYEKLRESNRRGLKEIGEKEIDKLGEFLKREFEQVIPKETFNDEYLALRDSWSEAILDLFRNAISASLSGEYAYFDVVATENATLSFTEDAWHVEVTLSNIRLQDPNETQSHVLAGEVRTRYTLQLDGKFMLDQFEATTPFLNRLCFDSEVSINADVLKQQSDELTFDSFVAAIEVRLQHGIKDPAAQTAYQQVLNEIVALKDHARKTTTGFEPLNELLKQTLSFMDGAVDSTDVESYKQAAARLSETSIGKKLAMAMMALAGFLLASMSIITHVMTAGTAAPFTIPGMIAGTAMFSASCFSFYQSWQKKSLERATNNLIPFVTVKAETKDKLDSKPKTTAEVHAHVLQRVDKIDEIIKQYQRN